MPRTKRCPLHPDGCTKHPNPMKGRSGTPGNPAKRHRDAALRGSLATLVALYHTPGMGNPRRRRRLVHRAQWEAGR